MEHIELVSFSGLYLISKVHFSLRPQAISSYEAQLFCHVFDFVQPHLHFYFSQFVGQIFA